LLAIFAALTSSTVGIGS